MLSENSTKIINTGNLENKICLFMRRWCNKDCENAPKSLYVFCDDGDTSNDAQSNIKECKNAIGIIVKQTTNDEFDIVIKTIMQSIDKIIRLTEKYDEIVFHVDGFDTEHNKLMANAPKTLAFIENIINECFGIDYNEIRSGELFADLQLQE
jgi:hypothetical protein